MFAPKQDSVNKKQTLAYDSTSQTETQENIVGAILADLDCVSQSTESKHEQIKKHCLEESRVTCSRRQNKVL